MPDSEMGSAANVMRVLMALQMTGIGLFEAMTIGEYWRYHRPGLRELKKRLWEVTAHNQQRTVMLASIAFILGVPLHDLVHEDFREVPLEDLRARYGLDRAKVFERAADFEL